MILTCFVFVWGLPQIKSVARRHLGAQVPGATACTTWSQKVPPVVAKPTPRRPRSTRSTGSRRPAPASCWPRSSRAWCMGYSLASLLTIYGDTLIAACATRCSRSRRCWRSASPPGTPALDATLGLAFAHTGVLYPFFGTHARAGSGVALTGSDTSSNVLFGSLQKITPSSSA